MKYFFHPEAVEEYLDAVSYYAGIHPRLAESFIDAVETGIESIMSEPLLIIDLLKVDGQRGNNFIWDHPMAPFRVIPLNRRTP